VQEPDPQVVAAARGGDTAAFELLVRRFQGDVWRLAFHLLRDGALADDVTQDAFVRAFRFLPRYRGEAKFSTWLFSIARNCAVDELRRAARRSRTSRRIESEGQTPGFDHAVRVEVREALAALPLDLREPVVMIDMFGMSYEEVARALKVPEGTIKSRMHRARATLARSLTPNEEKSTGEL
jgi:RNA polymerase sigma-70 factor (ECF subfamily)